MESSGSIANDLPAILEQRITDFRRYARRNYYAAYTCYVIAIAASFLATLAAATGSLSPVFLAVLTAVPGTALLANSVLSFEKKSAWYWKKTHHYEGLLMSLKYEKLELSAASKDLRLFDEKMESDYPKFGMMPHKNLKV